MIDHSILNEFKFKFGGSDYQPVLREQVEIVRNRFGQLFGIEKIPLLDETGRLQYENDGDPTKIVRVGGGFTQQIVRSDGSTSSIHLMS
jgi:hypothetical protein